MNTLPKIMYVASLKTGETVETYQNPAKKNYKIADAEPKSGSTNGLVAKQEPSKNNIVTYEMKTAQNSIEDLIRLKSKDVRISIEGAKKLIREKNLGYLIQDKPESSKNVASPTPTASIRNIPHIIHKKQSLSSNQTKSKCAEQSKSSSQTFLHSSSSQPILHNYLTYSKETKDANKNSSFKQETKQENYEPYNEEFDKQFKHKPMLQTILKEILMLHEEYESLETQSVDDEINNIRAKHGLPLFEPENPVVETPNHDDMNSDDNFVLISDDNEEDENSTHKISYCSEAKDVSQYEKQYEHFVSTMKKTGETNEKLPPKLGVITIDEDDATSSSNSSKNSPNAKMVNIRYKNKNFVLMSQQSYSSDDESALVIDETDDDDHFYETKRPKIEVCEESL